MKLWNVATKPQATICVDSHLWGPTFCSKILDGISKSTIPIDSKALPVLIWLVVTPRSSVIVLVKAFDMFPLSNCKAKNAKPRIGSKIKSTLDTGQ